jgi:F420H(2)-dependent quinone reductase
LKLPLTAEYEPSTSDRSRTQTERFERSGGAEGNTLRGMPIIVLTSIGAQSGKLRKTPLMRVEHNGEYAVVASLGGAPKHPVWYYNLKKNPHVELQDGSVKRDYLAREVTGDEKAVWWERAVEAYPDYAGYQRKTTREIPVFVLTPIDEDENLDALEAMAIKRPFHNRLVARASAFHTPHPRVLISLAWRGRFQGPGLRPDHGYGSALGHGDALAARPERRLTGNFQARPWRRAKATAAARDTSPSLP